MIKAFKNAVVRNDVNYLDLCGVKEVIFENFEFGLLVLIRVTVYNFLYYL